MTLRKTSKLLGPWVCFQIRFVLFLQETDSVESSSFLGFLTMWNSWCHQHLWATTQKREEQPPSLGTPGSHSDPFSTFLLGLMGKSSCFFQTRFWSWASAFWALGEAKGHRCCWAWSRCSHCRPEHASALPLTAGCLALSAGGACAAPFRKKFVLLLWKINFCLKVFHQVLQHGWC